MRPISLLYHDVVDGDAGASGFSGADADAYKLDEPNFIAHLDAISQTRDESRPVLLTFDDGGVSAHTRIAPLLEIRGWRGHFFIVTAKIDQPGFLTRAQIADLHRRGHHIGSHSHTHPRRFSSLSHPETLDELCESRRILSEILHEQPVSFSVPGGFYSSAVAHAAAEAGYRVLFNSEPTSRIRFHNGLTIMGRYGIKRDTTPAMAAALARRDLAPRLQQAVLWNIKKPLKKAGGPAWFAFRRWVFERNSGTVA
jgi:peptidoglycan/xylan/chitin deacetylase (PgdA/CDA1 family)